MNHIVHTYTLYCMAPLGGSSVIHEHENNNYNNNNNNNNNENYLHLNDNMERKKKYDNKKPIN